MLLWTPYINPRLDNQFENHVMPPHEYKNLMNLRIVMNFPPHLELTNQVSRETNSWNDQTSHMCFHYTSHHVTFKSRDIGIRLLWGFRLYLGILRRYSRFRPFSSKDPKYDLRSRRESSRNTVCSRIEYLSPFSSSLFPHQRVLWLFINFDPKSIGEMIDRLSIAV